MSLTVTWMGFQSSLACLLYKQLKDPMVLTCFMSPAWKAGSRSAFGLFCAGFVGVLPSLGGVGSQAAQMAPDRGLVE